MTPRRQPPRLPTRRYRVCLLLLLLLLRLLLLGDSDASARSMLLVRDWCSKRDRNVAR